MAIVESPFGTIDVPTCTITELVFEGLASNPDATVLIDGPSGRSLTGAELRDMIERLAGGLTARGYAPGKVIAIMAPNLPEYAAVFHAVAWAGGTVTTLNPTYTAEEVAYQLKDAGATLLVTVPPFLETAKTAVEGTGVSEIAVIGEAPGALALSDLMGPPMTAQAPVDPATHVVALPYSSGTTGMPKGVVLTHRNLVANVLQTNGTIAVAGDTVALAFLPYFHIYGMNVLMNGLLQSGSGQVTMPRFDLEAALKLIERHRITHLFVVPPVVLALAKHPMVDRFDLSSLGYMVSGAAPLGAELQEACSQRLGFEMVQAYGMTEMSPVSHVSPVGRSRPGASGLAVASTECRIVDTATGADLGPGEEGELWVRGPQVMIGYLNRPDATAETLTEDGWLKTGDVGSIDADGYLTLVDRVKELIKVKGFAVAPAELEALLVTHPGVADVAVIGVVDEEAGEVPKAFVVAGPEGCPDLAAAQAFLEPHVAHFKQIRALEVVETIPKSPSGKILRRMLRPSA